MRRKRGGKRIGTWRKKERHVEERVIGRRKKWDVEEKMSEGERCRKKKGEE